MAAAYRNTMRNLTKVVRQPDKIRSKQLDVAVAKLGWGLDKTVDLLRLRVRLSVNKFPPSRYF